MQDIKDVYYFSEKIQKLSKEKKNIILNDNEAIYQSLRIILTDASESQKLKILGEDAYLDYKIFGDQFTYYHIEENLKLFDVVLPGFKNKRKKISTLEEMALEQHEDLEILFISEKLRRKYFNDEDKNIMMEYYKKFN